MTESTWHRVGGISCLRRPGPGPVVVFLHGIGSNAASFAPFFDVVPTTWHLVAWNAPGYGGSVALADDWPLAEDYALALAGLLDDLGHASVHLLGHSLGTLMAAAFARRFPDRVHSLTLAAAATGYGVACGGALPAKAAARLADLSDLGPQAFAKARAANLVHDPEAHPDLVARLESAMGQVNAHGYGQAVRMLASGDLAGDLADVALRPGFVIGAQDRVTPMAQTLAAADAWEATHGARPTLVEIDQAGHAVYLQQPDAFRAALMTHMAEARARPFASPPEGV